MGAVVGTVVFDTFFLILVLTLLSAIDWTSLLANRSNNVYPLLEGGGRMFPAKLNSFLVFQNLKFRGVPKSNFGCTGIPLTSPYCSRLSFYESVALICDFLAHSVLYL